MPLFSRDRHKIKVPLAAIDEQSGGLCNHKKKSVNSSHFQLGHRRNHSAGVLDRNSACSRPMTYIELTSRTAFTGNGQWEKAKKMNEVEIKSTGGTERTVGSKFGRS
ncbi:hypothetical protein AFLA_013472 [Aspergillus flavus NRRL3357]|nr:hypothetical protein AFLA_013472 [Aspergillus flavus NRRL3357]